MSFNWKIFVVAFVFSLATGILSNVSQYLFQMFDFSPEGYVWVSFSLNVAMFFVSPALLFAFLYVIGGKTDLAAEFKSVGVSLFLGSWIGHLIGYFPLQFVFIAQYGGSFVGPVGLWFLWYGFRTAFSMEFFVGFAAFSMAYIARKHSL